MKIKAKLYLGIGLLFLMILILATVSTLFVSSLKKDTENVLSANYIQLNMPRNMLKASDEIQLKNNAILQLEDNFEKQKLNVTEPGEREITDRLSQQLEKLKSTPNDPLINQNFRTALVELMTVNMGCNR
ncbi:MCP four helix bundle domain-containing protein [Sphingobacterium daejeonense]|uniref:MCP four helix bundle domain-containing protein n=1 Tax=Sphingobacterium daejeonense TaxID=371142 RepID=UPI0010C4EC48|nr:MCP four helix bundle domain-containing protein [Sphingobacterium daejeonense]VTP97236.1 Four helix bundle sensory module for signal transduction [Sphingobacterium daejeonense]